jgi:PAS domain S-box-containing protein
MSKMKHKPGSEQKTEETEETLSGSETLFGSIAKDAHNFVVIADSDRRMVYVNKEARKLTGYTKKQLMGKDFSEFIFEEDRKHITGRFCNRLEGKKVPAEFEFRVKPKSGEIKNTESRSVLVVEADGAKFVVAHLLDITQRKNLLEKLRKYTEHLEDIVEERTHKLEQTKDELLKKERFAAIGQLAAIIGHDLRNPLTSITGCTYYLEKNLGDNASEKMKEMLVLIRKNIAYSDKIVNDLISYSEEINLEPHQTNPMQVVKATLENLPLPQNIQVVNLAKTRPTIKVDLRQLSRALSRIVVNAVDAMPEGGVFTIRSSKAGSNMVFTFTATGCGIPEQNLKRLWHPMFTTKAKGMGFGLPVCRRIVEAHGGSVSAQSVEGEETTLTITIPIEPKTEEGGEKNWTNQPESS